MITVSVESKDTTERQEGTRDPVRKTFFLALAVRHNGSVISGANFISVLVPEDEFSKYNVGDVYNITKESV